MRGRSKQVVSYDDPAMLARCLNPTQADFPVLSRMFNSRTIQGGVQVCPFSGMTLDFTSFDAAGLWTKSGDYGFYIPLAYTHAFGELGGDIFNPGASDFAFIVTGHYRSTDDPAVDGPNGLMVFGEPNSGPSIRINSSYSVAGVSQSVRKDLTNYLRVAANNAFKVATPRSTVEATVYRQSGNNIDYILTDELGNYYIANKDVSSVGTIAGGIGQLTNYAECNGWLDQSSWFTGIYLMVFPRGAPSSNFFKQALIWMAEHNNGMLYPGFLWMQG